jgi:hypothetical protein
MWVSYQWAESEWYLQLKFPYLFLCRIDIGFDLPVPECLVLLRWLKKANIVACKSALNVVAKFLVDCWMATVNHGN